MLLADYFSIYKEEIELIQIQNRVECDLYSIIAHIIRTSKQGASISLRDVSTRRETIFSRSFLGDAGFPDFVMRSREKREDAKILGAVEIKYVSQDLNRHMVQLQGHLKFYGRVIFTNGLEWRFYNEHNPSDNWSISLGDYNKGTIIWNSNEQWMHLLIAIDMIEWI